MGFTGAALGVAAVIVYAWRASTPKRRIEVPPSVGASPPVTPVRAYVPPLRFPELDADANEAPADAAAGELAIVGTVTRDGKPERWVQVGWIHEAGHRGNTEVTDEAGTYVLESVKSGRVMVYAVGSGAVALAHTSVGSEPNVVVDLELEPQEVDVIYGRAVDPAGRPLWGITARLDDARARNDRERAVLLAADSTTDLDGRFSFTVPGPGEYDVRFFNVLEPDISSRHVVTTVQMRTTNKGDDTPQDVNIVSASRTARCSVADAAGHAIPFGCVSIESECETMGGCGCGGCDRYDAVTFVWPEGAQCIGVTFGAGVYAGIQPRGPGQPCVAKPDP